MTAQRIILVRHGEVEPAAHGRCFGQQYDPPLSGRGRRQARALRDVLPIAGARVVSSPARRAIETVAEWNVPYGVDARWAERDFGAWEGERWTDCWSTAPHLADTAAFIAFTPPGAEDARTVEHRVKDAIRELWSSNRSAVVVTHAGPMRAALVVACGWSYEDAYAASVDVAGTFYLCAHEP